MESLKQFVHDTALLSAGLSLPLISEGRKVKISKPGAFRHRTGIVQEVRDDQALVTISMCVNAWIPLKSLEVVS